MRNLILFLLALTCFTCTTYKEDDIDNMRWFSYDTIFDDIPLHLRHPDYENMRVYKLSHPFLVNITHGFDSVKANGLPSSAYNSSLIDFDGEVVNLFGSKADGIIFLIETYGGERNYWFFSSDSTIAKRSFDDLKGRHNEMELNMHIRKDLGWQFLEDYPIQLYPK